MRIARVALVALLLGPSCKKGIGGTDVTPGDDEEPPRWHFDPIDHEQGSMTLTSIWSRSDGALFVAGWGGAIFTNAPTRANPDGGVWWSMNTGVTENLTAIVGVENGGQFGVPAVQGEMFAVGWHGTLLHFHPNPDSTASTDDGTWQVVAAPGQARLTARVKSDPACPDEDGDGVPDDGDGDGYWGNAICHSGGTAACDDNCRTSANGPDRPLSDYNDDACIGPGDGPLASEPGNPGAGGVVQQDIDGDGIGHTCDLDDALHVPYGGFDGALFDVAARFDGTNVTVLAVGEDGSLVLYRSATATTSVNDPAAWLAVVGTPYRYDNDCAPGSPPGQACDGSGRLPPACPAQCNPIKTICSCPVDQAQCCDASASTGAGCSDGSCGAAANACDGGSGACSPLCPDCFRRMDQTLRSVALDGDNAVMVGARGTVIFGNVTDPTLTWTAPTCVPTPKPLDDRPLLTHVSARGGAFYAVGAGGAVGQMPGGGCFFAPQTGSPIVFLSGVYATGGGSAYAVGDNGVLLQVNAGNEVQLLDTEITESLIAITVTYEQGAERLWMVGAGGRLLKGAFY